MICPKSHASQVAVRIQIHIYLVAKQEVCKHRAALLHSTPALAAGYRAYTFSVLFQASGHLRLVINRTFPELYLPLAM